MGAIDIKSAGKIYPNGTRALEDVSITINDGEFVVLVGPSGCGKTTLLRMVAGLEDITEGEISIGKKTVNEVAPKDRDIAMVFQNYALYPHMSVYDNMAFSLKLRKLPKDEIPKDFKIKSRFKQENTMSKKYEYKSKLFRKIHQLQKRLYRTEQNPGHSEDKVWFREMRIRKLLNKIREKQLLTNDKKSIILYV